MSYQLGSAGSGGEAELYAGPRAEDPRPRSRLLVASLVVLIGMGVFAGSLWFAYRQGLQHGSAMTAAVDVPLIRADERPTKVKPDKPGGMEIPDRDKLIYTQKRAAVEHLLPPPEKPMPRPTALSAAGQPEVSQSISGPAPPTSAAPSDQSQQAGKPPAAATVAAKPANPGKGVGARIQLASVRSEEAARQEWERLRRANSDLLANISAMPVPADLGEKGVFYRLQTAPVADADRICGELKRRNVGCIIAR